jgi:hypothetical protein
MAKVKSRKIGIVVKSSTAEALGMSVEMVSIRVNAILQRHKILPARFTSVLLKNGKPLICTTGPLIECDREMQKSNIRQLNVGTMVTENIIRRKFSVCPSGSLR